MQRRVVLVLTLLVTGCSFSPRGFDHGALARAARVDRHPVTEPDVAGAAALSPQLAPPFRVAVWFRPPNPWRWSEHRFHWTDRDREVVLAALQPLVDAGVVAEVVLLANAVFPDDGVRAARFAAARQGAHAVVIVTGAAALERYSNASALLYPTILGLWVAPGSHANALCLVSASVWDVKDGYLYAAAETEGTVRRRVPYMHLDEDEVAEGAKRAALEELAGELGRSLGRLKEPGVAATATQER